MKKTTEGVLQAKARRQRNRAERRAQEAITAASLGITEVELKRQRFEEVQQMLARQKQLALESEKRAYVEMERQWELRRRSRFW